MTFPLNDLKVLDMSRVLAGPFAGRMLADLGADVVKVEPPNGDVTRFWGANISGIAGYYHQQNVGKRNICIDLHDPKGPEIIKQLVSVADVLIENFRPDVMPKFGLSYAELEKINPRLVMLSISGFGAGGPESKRAAYAPIIHAESGLLERQGKLQGGKLTDIAVSVADTNASMHGLVGLLSALLLREKTGVGDHVDVAMLDAMLVNDDALHFSLENSWETKGGAAEVWETSAGPLIIAGDFRFIWRQLNEVCGVSDPTPEGAVLEDKIRLRRSAAATYFNKTCSSRDEVIVNLDKMNLAWGDVRSMASIPEQPTVQHRKTITRVDDRSGGTRPVVQSPYRFTNAESGVRAGAAHKGEHNEVVLKQWLSWTTEEILGVGPALVGDSEKAE